MLNYLFVGSFSLGPISIMNEFMFAVLYVFSFRPRLQEMQFSKLKLKIEKELCGSLPDAMLWAE